MAGVKEQERTSKSTRWTMVIREVSAETTRKSQRNQKNKSSNFCNNNNSSSSSSNSNNTHKIALNRSVLIASSFETKAPDRDKSALDNHYLVRESIRHCGGIKLSQLRWRISAKVAAARCTLGPVSWHTIAGALVAVVSWDSRETVQFIPAIESDSIKRLDCQRRHEPALWVVIQPPRSRSFLISLNDWIRS